MVTEKKCKKFLAKFFKKNPQILRAVFSKADQSQLGASQKDLEKEKYWLMEDSADPLSFGNGITEYGLTEYQIFTDGTAVSYDIEPGPKITRPLTDFIMEHLCYCEPFGMAAVFMVLEDHNGKLHLGNYMGD